MRNGQKIGVDTAENESRKGFSVEIRVELIYKLALLAQHAQQARLECSRFGV